MIKIIAPILFLLNGICYANDDSSSFSNNLDEGKRLLFIDEKFTDALSFFTKELRKARIRGDKKMVGENIYWIAECLFQIRKLKELDSVLKDGEIYMKKEKLYKTYDNLLLTRAKYLIDIGKNKEAIKLLKKIEKKSHALDYILREKLIAADAYYRDGELEKSKKLYDFIIRNSHDSLQIGQAYNGIGSYYFMLSDFDNAKIMYESSLTTILRYISPRHTRVAIASYNLGLLAEKKGNYNEQESMTKRAANIYMSKFGLYHPKTAEAFGTLGNIFNIVDNVGKCSYYYKKELDILINLYGDKNPSLIYNYLNYTDIYIYNNKSIDAESEIIKAKEIIKLYYNRTHNIYTQCTIKECQILTQKKDFLKSEKLLTDVIKINKKHPNDYLPDAYYLLGCNYLAQRKYKEAIYNLQKANNLFVHFFGDKNIYSIDPLTDISNAFLQQDKPIDALKYAQYALEHTLHNNTIIFPYDHWECVMQILKCKKELYKKNLIPFKECKSDIELIKKTLNEANAIKQTYYSSGSQLHYADKMSELNKLGIYFLTHYYKLTDTYFLDNLLYFTENNKANLLRYKISSNVSSHLLPEKEREKLFFITDKLNEFITLNENQEEATFTINDSILFYQNLHEDFIKNLEKKYPKIYAIKYGQKPYSVKQIQKKLKENYTFLNYCNDDENYYCLSISKKNITFKICGNKTTIDSVVRLYQMNLVNIKFNKNLNLKLSELLLPKSLNKNILISSDDILQHISFDALYKNLSKNYLIYNHTIQYAFSAGTYFNHQPLSKNKNILAFFPNFDNTKYATLNSEKEQKSLINFCNYIEKKDSLATKKAFLKCYKTSNIIHIASHLIVDTILPLESALLFQPNNDYQLTINDIWRLNTNTQLVTLAACHSNFGKTQNGEGMQNFAWAFQYAGAHNILSTQWNASDKSTANIISDFYEFIRNGKSKEEALCLAKIKYIESSDAIGAQPYFWANYCLYTDETDIKIKSYFLTKFGLFTICFLFVSYIAYKNSSKKKSNVVI